MRPFPFPIALALTVFCGFDSAVYAQTGMLLVIPHEQNITSDSPAGWRPSHMQIESVSGAIAAYYTALDANHYPQVYAMMTEQNARLFTLAQFAESNNKFNQLSGQVISRSIVKVTWTKDPAAAPAPGVYAAVDIAGKYANIDRYCSYLIFYQKTADQEFKIMRTEANYIDNATAQNIEQKQSRATLNKLWADLSKHCP